MYERLAMKIGFVTIAYCLAEATQKLIDSAVSTRHDVDYHLFLHSQNEQVVNVCKEIVGYSSSPLSDDVGVYEGRTGVHYYPYGTNRGLSKSWNEGMLAAYGSGADVVIICNDDIEFSPGDLELLAEWAVANPDRYVVSCNGWQRRMLTQGSIGYSCFAINRIALEQVGCFDENIFPIYFEDCDYSYRAKLLGLHLGHVHETTLYHGGSMTVNSDEELGHQHNFTFVRNESYYMRKWGGKPGEETYTHPFNDASLPLKIQPENCRAPYGAEYDRTDQYIVKV